MDEMFTRHKQEFISAVNATIDMLSNSRDVMDLEANKGRIIDGQKYKEICDNIFRLNEVLVTLKSRKELDKESQNIAIGALATSVVLMDYLSEAYKEAAERGKIIIANIQSENWLTNIWQKSKVML